MHAHAHARIDEWVWGCQKYANEKILNWAVSTQTWQTDYRDTKVLWQMSKHPKYCHKGILNSCYKIWEDKG